MYFRSCSFLLSAASAGRSAESLRRPSGPRPSLRRGLPLLRTLPKILSGGFLGGPSLRPRRNSWPLPYDAELSVWVIILLCRYLTHIFHLEGSGVAAGDTRGVPGAAILLKVFLSDNPRRTGVGRCAGPLGGFDETPGDPLGIADRRSCVDLSANFTLAESWGRPLVDLCKTPGILWGCDEFRRGLPPDSL